MPNQELSKIIGKILASPYVYAATRVEGYSLGDVVMETLTKFETFDSIPEDYKKLYAMAEFSCKLIEKLDPNHRYAGTLREDQVSPVYLQTLEAFGPNSLELRPTDKQDLRVTNQDRWPNSIFFPLEDILEVGAVAKGPVILQIGLTEEGEALVGTLYPDTTTVTAVELSALLTFNQGDITFYPKAKPWLGRST